MNIPRPYKHTPDPASICLITQQLSKCLIESPLISQNPGRMCSPSCAPQSSFHFELNLSEHLKTAREKMLMKSKNGWLNSIQMKCTVHLKKHAYKEKAVWNEIKGGRHKSSIYMEWVHRWEWEDTLRTSHQIDPQSTRQVYLIICTGKAAGSSFYTAREKQDTLRHKELFPHAFQMDIASIILHMAFLDHRN